MFSSKSDYDRGINTFSPQGRIYQVEYAIQAIKLGSSALGIKVQQGVVLAGQRRLNSTLIIPTSIEKIYPIDDHITVAASGVVTDARVLVDHARVQAQYHKTTFLQPLRVRALSQIVSDLALNFGDADSSSKKKPMSRPYGVALLVAGIDDTGPNLFQIYPSGTMFGFKAKGIGAAEQAIQSILNQKYNEKMSLEQVQKLALYSLKQVMQQRINKKNVQLCVISMQNKKFQVRQPEYVDQIINNLKD